MTRIGLLNGPNLNRLGKRQPELYGTRTLENVVGELRELAALHQAELEAYQSNHEGALIDRIHAWADIGLRWAIINPGGLTHTSIALRDAIAGTDIRFVEVHISHIHSRESFRHLSMIAPVCVAQISGMGTYGYSAALQFILQQEH